jgi:SAM-dependent methyltransferase
MFKSIKNVRVMLGKKDEYEIGEIMNKTSASSQSKILDVGCGTGHHVAELSGRSIDVIGIDISPSMIKKARESYPDYDFEVQFFDDRVTPIERVVVNWEEQFVDLPNVTPGNTTYTHLGFKQINDKIKAGEHKPNIVILVTDGQTNSSRTFLENEIKLFKFLSYIIL